LRFAFSDDQLAFRDAARDLLAQQCPPAVVRAAWPEGGGPTGPKRAVTLTQVWASLAEMGVLGVAVPEAAGGLGLSELDWVLLAEEAGYAALPFPLVETAGVVAPLLAAHGDPGGHLAGLVDGSKMATAQLVGDGPVPFAQRADLALLRAGVGGQSSGLVLIDLRRARRQAVVSVDGSRALAEVTVAGDAEPVTDDPTEIELVVQRGTLGAAAALLGLSRRMLDLTVEYVKERRQFGVAIGSFQAVKHHLADARLQLEFAAPAVYRAAWSLATGAPTAARDVSMAKAVASDAAELTGRQALQCHGAIGYTVEYDLHLYLKRAWALTRDWGDAASHRSLVADALEV